MRWSWRAFRVGAAGAVDSDAFNSSPARSPTPRTDPAALSPAPLALYTLTRLHVPARTLPTLRRPRARRRGPHPLWMRPPSGGFSLGARVLAGDYGRRCPEGMLGVTSARPVPVLSPLSGGEAGTWWVRPTGPLKSRTDVPRFGSAPGDRHRWCRGSGRSVRTGRGRRCG